MPRRSDSIRHANAAPVIACPPARPAPRQVIFKHLFQLKYAERQLNNVWAALQPTRGLSRCVYMHVCVFVLVYVCLCRVGDRGKQERGVVRQPEAQQCALGPKRARKQTHAHTHKRTRTGRTRRASGRGTRCAGA